MSLLQTERETYEAMWGIEPYAVHSPGETYVPLFLDMTQDTMRISVVDAGCGTGKGALALKAAGFFDVRLCDLTSSGLVGETSGMPFHQVCLWHELRHVVGFADWVYCCDVLEHIPTAFTMLTVSRLLEVAKRGVFLSIALVPDAFGVWIGKPLHQTVQSFTAWHDQLNEVGEVVEARDLLNVGVYLVRPR